MDIFVFLLILQLTSITAVWRYTRRKIVQINLMDSLNHNKSRCGVPLVYPEGYSYCGCDPECVRYGDCCKDSQYFKDVVHRWGKSPFSCTELRVTGSFYMMSTCPSNWKHNDTRISCENPDITYRDPFLEVPVFSVRTNITYRNGHCAICNQDFDPQNDILWFIDFLFDESETIVKYLNDTIISDSQKRLYFNEEEKSWFLNITDVDFPPITIHDKLRNSYSADMIIVRPPSTETTPRVCVADVIGKCAGNWTESEKREKCELYTDIYFDCPKIYRNPHCAVCNNVSRYRKTNCVTRVLERGPEFASFSVLLDWKTKRDVKCSEIEFFDSFSQTCRKIPTQMSDEDSEEDKMNARRTEVSRYGPTLTRNKNVTQMERPGNTSKPDTQSTQNSIGGERRKNLNDENVWEKLPSQDHNLTDIDIFLSETYHHTDTASYNPHGIMSMKQDLTQAYVTIVGIAISVLCLLIHLVVFIATPKLRNMPAMNLASLCVSLLFLYSTFIAGVIEDPPCRIIAVFIHYGLLVTFCWMLAISFDVWRAIRQIINDFFVPTELERRRRFLFYSTFCWIFPALIVILALIFEFSDTGFRPGYGTVNCWISNPDAVLAFSFVPLCVIMGCDVIFFCWSSYLVYTSKSKLINSSTAPPMDFQIFIKLGLIMGLTWITGLVAASVNVKALWYVFVLFNTLQGCFIFIAFSCTRKVWKEISQKMPFSHFKNTVGTSFQLI